MGLVLSRSHQHLHLHPGCLLTPHRFLLRTFLFYSWSYFLSLSFFFSFLMIVVLLFYDFSVTVDISLIFYCSCSESKTVACFSNHSSSFRISRGNLTPLGQMAPNTGLCTALLAFGCGFIELFFYLKKMAYSLKGPDSLECYCPLTNYHLSVGKQVSVSQLRELTLESLGCTSRVQEGPSTAPALAGTHQSPLPMIARFPRRCTPTLHCLCS